MRITGEFGRRPVDAATVELELAAILEGVFDRVGVKVLVNIVATEMPAAKPLGFDGPVILHPAALVDVVDQKVAVRPAAGPQK